MTPTDDPFDTRPTADQLATDALLDRLGARAPTPDDLDDPLVAALALMAAEIDLDAVPADRTRTALARALPDAAPIAPRAPDVPPHDEQTGLVLDLRDGAPRPRPGLRSVGGRAGEARSRRRPTRGREPARAPSAAMAPPRSLARVPSSHGPGGSRGPQDRRERRLRPMVAVAVALVAIVAGSGMSAAVTGGRSVNPFTGIQLVVAELTGGRTTDQTAALNAAERALDRADAHVRARDYDKARAELNAAAALLPRLATDDRKTVERRIATLRSGLRR